MERHITAPPPFSLASSLLQMCTDRGYTPDLQDILDSINLGGDLRCGKFVMAGPNDIPPAITVMAGADMSNFSFGLPHLRRDFSPFFRRDLALYILYHLLDNLSGEHLHKIKA